MRNGRTETAVTESGEAAPPSAAAPESAGSGWQRLRCTSTGSIAVASAALLVIVVNRWGTHLLEQGADLRILAPPLVGRYRWTADAPVNMAGVLIVAVVGGVLVWLGPRVSASLPWRHLLLVSALATAVWAVALASVDGVAALARPMGLPGHSLLDVPSVADPRDFLAGFTDLIDGYGTHTRAHPPGFVLVLWGLDRVGLGGQGWAAALVIAAGALATPSVLIAVREIAGEASARALAPFLALIPAALYVATTSDAFFAGVGSAAIACVILATGRDGRRADGLAILGGLLFGATAMLSYGLALLALIPLAVAVARRRARPILVAGAAGATVMIAVALAGFSWIDGLAATHEQYLASVARNRPYGYFLVANIAAFAVIVGPAVIAGTVQMRDRGLRLLVGSALVAMVAADLSGMSKGEVERIWLPFAFWVAPAAAAVAIGTSASRRGWLAGQAALAAGVQLAIRTHW